MFSWEFREIFKNIFFKEHLQTTSSENWGFPLSISSVNMTKSEVSYWQLAFPYYEVQVKFRAFTTQKMKFSITDFFSTLQIWSHLLKKSVMENFIFCAVLFFLKIKRGKPQLITKFILFLVILLNINLTFLSSECKQYDFFNCDC